MILPGNKDLKFKNPTQAGMKPRPIIQFFSWAIQVELHRMSGSESCACFQTFNSASPSYAQTKQITEVINILPHRIPDCRTDVLDISHFSFFFNSLFSWIWRGCVSNMKNLLCINYCIQYALSVITLNQYQVHLNAKSNGNLYHQFWYLPV